jgi:hypothetical protein
MSSHGRLVALEALLVRAPEEGGVRRVLQVDDVLPDLVIHGDPVELLGWPGGEAVQRHVHEQNYSSHETS